MCIRDSPPPAQCHSPSTHTVSLSLHPHNVTLPPPTQCHSPSTHTVSLSLHPHSVTVSAPCSKPIHTLLTSFLPPPTQCHSVSSMQQTHPHVTNFFPPSTHAVSPPQNKRGSTASLSQVEDSMYRQRGQSSSSLGRLDPSYLRSAQSSPAGYSPSGFSPEEAYSQNSPTRYASLPSRGKQKARKASKQVGSQRSACVLSSLSLCHHP